MGTSDLHRSAGVHLSPAVLVVISSSEQERMRAVAELGDLGPVLLVDDVSQARAVLDRRWDTGEKLARVAPGASGAVLAHAVPASTGSRWPGGETPLPGLRLDPEHQTAVTARARVPLTNLEFNFLSALVSVPGQVCRTSDLVVDVWGTSYVGRGTQVHSVVKRLRRKLTDAQAPVRLETVRGIGFRVVHRRPSEASA
ncbi:MAG: hypothetical protein GX555_16645 [Actinomycetales bacterium]|nr:hypothetical protein [Actinomycetales bacterium]